MKYIIGINILLFSLLGADGIDDIVNKIKSIREGSVNKEKLSKTASPIATIISLDKNNSAFDSNSTQNVVSVNDETYALKAIINNRAFINNKWVKVGQKIGPYTLVDVMDDSVYLKDKTRTKMIFLKPLNSKIKITGR